ncbi:hypothetical protein [Azospirillum doebereinerae]|uniref:Uncharacterized protein n=1 Tax=Azospirillum doebereinerae TaxID=92933 RepID=A0A433J1D3_9PROT|nr:hypothetical protein [Azospirillum doebereinerae]RUQ64010.1 hypothetical protein EJ913_27190 [Azospirillum doebereinerae]
MVADVLLTHRPRLSRPLKPLLAEVLTGEPWLAALRDPRDTAPAVTAACIVSYISRRHPAWETVPGDELGEVLVDLIAADRVHHLPGDWLFLDAVERLLLMVRWGGFDPMLEPYRVALRD